MANKPIELLPQAADVSSQDLFVLGQSGVAKSLTWTLLISKLAEALDGHGGISEITGPVSEDLVDTYTIVFADGQETEFTVTNGADGVIFTPSVSSEGVISWTNDGGLPAPTPQNIKGPAGASSYTYIKWAAQSPTSDNDMSDYPDEWMGIYAGDSATAPTSYTSYSWYKVKGLTGDQGLGIGSIAWLSNSSGEEQGTAGTTDTYQVKLSDDTVVGTFDVSNGLNGTGLVDTVNGVAPVNGNVVLTAADVGAASAALHISANITTSPATISNSAITSDMRVINIEFGTPTAVKSNVPWTTSDGQIVLGDANTFSSSTAVDIILSETT